MRPLIAQGRFRRFDRSDRSGDRTATPRWDHHTHMAPLVKLRLHGLRPNKNKKLPNKNLACGRQMSESN